MTTPEPESPSEQEENEKSLAAGVAFAVMGTTAAGCVGAGVALGAWFDGAEHSSPAGLLVGIVVGLTAAVVSVVQQIRRFL